MELYDTIVAMKMNIILTAMAFMTLVLGVYFTRAGTQVFRSNEVKAPSVLSEVTDEEDEGIKPTESPSATPTAKPTIKPSASPKPSNTPGSQTTSNAEISQFVYPGATINSQTNTTLKLSTTASPNDVTPWYKNKMSELKMNARSIAATNTNGNVLNKLAGASSKLEVEIEIKKSASESTTHIDVKLQND